MMQKPTMRSTWLPLGMVGLALLVLNAGLYTRLASQQEAQQQFTFPYREDFSALTVNAYDEFGGDWEIRDGTLVQINTEGYDLGTLIPMTIPAEQPYKFEATLRYIGGMMGGGLMFNAQQTTSRQKSHMARFNVDADRLWVIYGYFADDSSFIGQGSTPLDIAPNDPTPHRMGVLVNNDRYSLVIDGSIVVADVPLQYRGGTVGFISAASQTTFDDVVVEALQTVTPEATPPVDIPESTPSVVASDEDQQVLFSETFDGSGGSTLWLPLSGDWQFRDSLLIQQQPEGFDLLTIYQQPFTTPMTLEATFTHRSGSGAGLVFNLPTPNSRNGGYMVRYFEDGAVLAWGYFDEVGNFVGEGSTAVAPPMQDAHTLRIEIGSTTFNIQLDGVELVANAPINAPQTSQYIGLTTSQSSAAFQAVRVLGSGTSDPPQGETATDIDTVAAIGVWTVEGGVITQTATESTEYIAGAGLAAERFILSVDILLPTDVPDVGAGIIFHMDARNDHRSGQMVRFGSAGQELFWGVYDEQRIFTGQGDVRVGIPPGTRTTLTLSVQEATFDIRVNDETVAANLPLQRGSGWIGLLSFGGPVTFSNIRLELGG